MTSENKPANNMTTINTGGNLFTLVNIFYVKPDNQQALVDLLVEETKQTMQYQPGFVSANIHKSYDGKRVVNYAQWRSEEDFEAMLQADEVKPKLKRAAELAEDYDPITCEVIESISKKP